MAEDKKKNKDIFGTIGDLTYDAQNKYHGWVFDILSFKHGLFVFLIYIIVSNIDSLLKGDLPSIILVGITLSYGLLYYYLFESEPDTESDVYKIMNIIHTIFVITVCVGILLFFIKVYTTYFV